MASRSRSPAMPSEPLVKAGAVLMLHPHQPAQSFSSDNHEKGGGISLVTARGHGVLGTTLGAAGAVKQDADAAAAAAAAAGGGH